MRFLFLINLTFFVCGGIPYLVLSGTFPAGTSCAESPSSPEQRAMALQEANRLRGSAGTVQSNNAVPIC